MKKELFYILCVLIVVFSSVSFLTKAQDFDFNRSHICTMDDIVEMINSVDESLVFYYFDNLMEFGFRYTGSDNCTRAGEYIYDEFESMGLDVEFHNWSYNGFKSRNVVATLKGVDLSSNAVFIISAHYDCTPGSMGANDDGSGVAAMMATALLMSNYSFNHTIRFIAFTGEEVGTYGSFIYAREAYNHGDNIVAVLNVDMVGYADTTTGGKKIRFFQVERSNWIVDFAKSVSEKYLELVDLAVEGFPNYRGSDHQAFLDYGYDSVFIAHYDGYRWGHSPEDTPDRINHTYEVKATKFLLALLAEIASKPIDLQVLIKHPKEGFFYFFNKSIFPLSFGRLWSTGLRGTTIIIGRANTSVEVISNEKIERVIYCIDDIFIWSDSNPPYEWKIQGKHCPPIGRHKLKVYVYTKSGKIATDEMDIIIFTLSCQYCKW